MLADFKTGKIFLTGVKDPTNPQSSTACLKVTPILLYSGNDCAALIQKNGWKIPDDYPIKF